MSGSGYGTVRLTLELNALVCLDTANHSTLLLIPQCEFVRGTSAWIQLSVNSAGQYGATGIKEMEKEKAR